MQKMRWILGGLGIYLGIISLFWLIDGMLVMLASFALYSSIRNTPIWLGNIDEITLALIVLIAAIEIGAGAIGLWCFCKTPSAERIQAIPTLLAMRLIVQIIGLALYWESVMLSSLIFWTIRGAISVAAIAVLAHFWKRRAPEEECGAQSFPFIRILLGK